MTPAEARMWKLLQSSQLKGRKFRRQHSVGSYILDFYCPKEKLAVELDGQVHEDPLAAEYDKQRTDFLNNAGIRVARFENHLVFERPEAVLESIATYFD